MANQLERRVAALESAATDQRVAYVWRNIGQTAEQAIAAKFPDGVPADAKPIIIGWIEPELGPEYV